MFMSPLVAVLYARGSLLMYSAVSSLICNYNNKCFAFFFYASVCKSTNLYMNIVRGKTINRQRHQMNRTSYFKLITPAEYYSIVFLVHSLITFRHTEKIEK